MKIRILVLPVITILFALSLVITAGCQFLTTSPKTATTVAGNTTSIYTTHVTIPVASGTAQPLPSIADVVAMVKPSVVAINVKATVTTYDIYGR